MVLLTTLFDLGNLNQKLLFLLIYWLVGWLVGLCVCLFVCFFLSSFICLQYRQSMRASNLAEAGLNSAPHDSKNPYNTLLTTSHYNT